VSGSYSPDVGRVILKDNPELLTFGNRMGSQPFYKIFTRNNMVASEEDLIQSSETQPNANGRFNTSDNSIDKAGNGERRPVFHRVTRCPKCGEDDLNHFDFGVYLRSRFLGVTSEGEAGCGQIESQFSDISCSFQ
jgi:hypothetical protein